MARPHLNDILRDAELLSILGTINVEWDEIEVDLWRIFWKLLGGPWNHSYAIFYSQQNHRARREMVEALAGASLANGSPELKKVSALLGRMKRAATKRNEIAHGIWDLSREARGPGLRRLPMKKNFAQTTANAYSKEDLKRLCDQLTKLRDDLDDFIA